ncbi:hypothetical protein BC793_109333 [Actinoplanes xinjiangensis]|uniref:Uncharacterized protein n=1 Tax=Actinoplanes xinjiangensis TaxID=512350 RepID=A0A316FFB3_9ACTN|nr:hypothetical protein BC793_109333 [Actinoplanes xinjiangensis]
MSESRNFSGPRTGEAYVRLSPKTVFLALLVVGLPFAVVAGWALGAPTVRQATLGASGLGGPLGGDGALGSAPGSGHRPAGNSPARPRPTADPASSQPVPATGPRTVTTTVTVVRTAGPSHPVESTDPPLTDPPVPTPTQVSASPEDPFGFPLDPSATPEFPFPPGLGDPMGFERFRYWRR